MYKNPNRSFIPYGAALRRTLLLAGIALGSAQATTYSIQNTNMDLVSGGSCGFREALAANNFGVAQWGCPAPEAGTVSIIELIGGTYTAPAALSVTRSVIIRCVGPGVCTIDAGTLNSDLFTITGGNNPSVTLSKTTLRQSSGNTNSISGLVVQAGTVNLEETVLTGFKVVGLSIRAGSGHTLRRSTFSNNGYGIDLWSGVSAVSRSNTVSNNWMGVQATGVNTFSDSGSVISNSVDVGFKLRAGKIHMERTTVRGNRNGGIHFDPGSVAHLYYCTIEGNKTPTNGAGVRVLVNPNTGADPAFVEIHSSTISNNRAGNNGGGVYVTGTLTLKTVTVSNDTADNRGGGIYHEPHPSGPGSAYMHLFHSTVAFNRASKGGGVYQIAGSSPFNSDGSIIAQNFAVSDSNVFGHIGSIRTLYGTLGAGYTGSHSNDIYPSNPLLGPLMDNAGPNRVKTHALLAGSPAIDYYDYDALITDARGFPRPGLWDLGAYESGPFQTELLTVIGKSSQDDHTLQTEAGLNNGLGTVLWANAVGDYVIYAVAIPEPGTYDISMRIKAGPNRAIVELATAPGDNVFTYIGTVDLYRSSLAYVTRSAGSFSFDSAGIKHFRLKVTGKNASSTGYLCLYDYINIIKQ